MSTTVLDALIIGTGQAGPSLAMRLAGAGRRTAIVEQGAFGGTCVNTGCTPTKALVASAYAAHIARRSADYGVILPQGKVQVDMPAVKRRKDAIVSRSATSLESSLRSTANLTVVQGRARFVAPRTVQVGQETFSAGKVFINVGGRPAIPPLRGVDEVPYLTSDTVLDVQRVPEHLIVVGGSYIGLEFAQMYRRFGAEVTIVEMAPRLIGREDEDVSDAIREILAAEGIRIRLGAECISLARTGASITVGVSCREGEPAEEGSDVLLATGRVPNTNDLGLEHAGVKLDDKGYIVVDDELRTSERDTYALGDCNGKGAFTHTAYNDFEIVAANLLDGAKRRVSDRKTAYALYIDPPLGRIGVTAAEAQRAGSSILVGKRPMSRVARAVEKGETQGFIKLVVERDSKRLLGAAVLGVGGDEVVHSLIDALYAGIPYPEIQQSVRIHPTVSELIPTVLGNLEAPA
jgi:pyruvate/2-oxoglutarate dehydrogenase complex dihydrolipoamide dehydrogenase (E3) component